MKNRLIWLYSTLAVLGELTLAILFVRQGVWFGALIAFVGLGFSGIAYWVRSSLVASLVFLVMSGLSGIAVLNGLPELWVLASLCLNLAAWNSFTFISQLQRYAENEFEPMLVNQFLIHLSGVTAAGFLAGIAALTVRAQMNFSLVIALAVLALAGLIVSVRYLTNRYESPKSPET